MYYKLDSDHNPVKIDIHEFDSVMSSSGRTISKDIIGDITISTVFLGIDHAFGGGEPVLFETMIFGGEHDEYQERYHTWDQAKEGHERALLKVQNIDFELGEKLYHVLSGNYVFFVRHTCDDLFCLVTDEAGKEYTLITTELVRRPESETA